MKPETRNTILIRQAVNHCNGISIMSLHFPNVLLQYLWQSFRGREPAAAEHGRLQHKCVTDNAGVESIRPADYTMARTQRDAGKTRRGR
jgi:hypothetical protein